jgi:uncharacterized protein (TIGR03086 family)
MGAGAPSAAKVVLILGEFAFGSCGAVDDRHPGARPARRLPGDPTTLQGMSAVTTTVTGSTMSLDPLDALEIASAELRSHLVEVGEAWHAATPCDDWDVRFLLAHVVGGNRFATMVLAGATSADAIATVTNGRQLGDEPVADYDASTASQREAFGRAGALGSLVSHPVGDITGARFLSMRVFDIAVHAWDLATALGRTSGLDDELAQHVLDALADEGPGLGFGIEPTGASTADAPARARLLDLSGRLA